MVYRFLADVVVLLHATTLVFFVVGGFLAWKWRRLIWVHLFIVAWNLIIVILDFGCPVTSVEKSFRRLGGEEPYAGGFIAHYLDGPVWPEGGTPWAEKIGFVLVVIAYVGYFLTRRRSSPAAEPRDRSVDTRT